MGATTSAFLFNSDQSSTNAGMRQFFFDGVTRCAVILYRRAMKTILLTILDSQSQGKVSNKSNLAELE